MQPVYNDKYVTAKIKIYNNRINTKFQGNTIPEDNEYCNSLSATLSDSVVKIDNNYYPQIFSEECKYAKKKKKRKKKKSQKRRIIISINEALNLDKSDDEFDNGKSNESDED